MDVGNKTNCFYWYYHTADFMHFWMAKSETSVTNYKFAI